MNIIFKWIESMQCHLWNLTGKQIIYDNIHTPHNTCKKCSDIDWFINSETEIGLFEVNLVRQGVWWRVGPGHQRMSSSFKVKRT